MGPARTTLVSLWLSCCACAQSTLIVDGAAGPGSQFTDLPAAIASAAPGDLVLLRPTAIYTGVVVDKPLEIRSENAQQRARVQSLTVENLAVLEGVAIRDLIIQSNGGDVLTVRQCDAVVRLERIDFASPAGTFSTAFLDDARRVELETIRGLGGIRVQDTSLRADDVQVLSGGPPALDLLNSYALVTGSLLRGFSSSVLDCNGPMNPVPTSACALSASRLLLDDTSSLQPGVLSRFLPPSICTTTPAIDGSGVVLLDGVTSPPSVGTSVTTVAQDWFEIDVDPLAGVGPLPLELQIGSLPSAFLFVGIVAAQPIVIAPTTALWIDPTVFLPVSGATADPNGVCRWSVAVPPTLALGTPIAWQALVDPFGVFATTEPSITMRR